MPDPKPWCKVHVGTVIAVNKWSDTHVAGSGGGGYITQHGGYVRPTTVSSTVSQNIEIFSRDEGGVEATITLGDTSIAFREGSRILAVWGAEFGGDMADILYVENLDVGDVHAPRWNLIVPDSWGFYNGLGMALLLASLTAILFLSVPEKAFVGFFLVLVIVWATWGPVKSARLANAAQEKRQAFVDDMIAMAAQKGFHLSAETLAPLKFRRHTTVGTNRSAVNE